MANDIGTNFSGREMLLTEPDWIEEIGSRFAVERRLLGYDHTVKVLSSLNTDAPINLEINFPLTTHEDIYDILDFFNLRKAKTESFWFLHPASLFTLLDTYTASDTYIKCVRNYSHLWTQGLASQDDWGIYIKMRNGDLITRKVTGIVDNASPPASYVYLDETIPRNIHISNHYMIGRILVGRFDQDDIVLKLEAKNQGRTNIKLQENYREFENWSPSSFSRSSESSDSSEST